MSMHEICMRDPEGARAGARTADRLFAHLPRSDQRRWAAAYLTGLLTTPGKKSLRRMAESISSSPTASQALQQFINASTWPWGPARRELVSWTAQQTVIRAWVPAPVLIPKRGQHSVGVHRRFAPETGRVVNCQLAMGMFLATDRGAVPVDWRLHLPGRWARERHVRERARVPDDVPAVREVPVLALDLIESLSARTDLARVPVLSDVTAGDNVRAFVATLLLRGKDFAIAVPESTQVITGGILATPAAPGRTAARALAAGRLVRALSGPEALLVPGAPPAPRLRALPDPVRLPDVPRPLRLITQWSPVGRGLERIWLTNIDGPRAREVPALISLYADIAASVRSMAADCGLHDFEGRSFPGWHHHMTMVSAARSHHLLAGPSWAPPALGRALAREPVAS